MIQENNNVLWQKLLNVYHSVHKKLNKTPLIKVTEAHDLDYNDKGIIEAWFKTN